MIYEKISQLRTRRNRDGEIVSMASAERRRRNKDEFSNADERSRPLTIPTERVYRATLRMSILRLRNVAVYCSKYGVRGGKPSKRVLPWP